VEMLAGALNKNLVRQKQLAKELFDFGESIIQEVNNSRNMLNKYLCLNGAEASFLKEIMTSEEGT
jgi:hypothetical protein